MPKVVDHAARRAELAQALWRVVERDGVDAASVRSVAAEAGWSPSALRHYFTTQTELLAFAVEHVVEQGAARIRALDVGGPGVGPVLRLLEESLPLDLARRREAELWLLLAARTVTDDAATATLRTVDSGLRGLAEWSVALLAERGLLDPALDAGVEADRLHALLDGLAIHVVMRPAAVTPERARAVLAAHVADLAPPVDPGERPAPDAG